MKIIITIFSLFCAGVVFAWNSFYSSSDIERCNLTVYYLDWELRTRSASTPDMLRNNHTYKIHLSGEAEIEKMRKVLTDSDLKPRKSNELDDVLDFRVLFDFEHCEKNIDYAATYFRIYFLDNYNNFSINEDVRKKIADTVEMKFSSNNESQPHR